MKPHRAYPRALAVTQRPDLISEASMKPPIKTLEIDAPDVGNGNCEGLYVVVNGVRIAQRGEPGSQQAGAWVPLEPGWTVRGPDDHSAIEVCYNGQRVH